MGLILNSHTTADGRAQRHHCCGPRIYQTLGEDNIVRSVGEDSEAFSHKNARSF